MPFVEVFVPTGSLTDAQRAHITDTLVAEVMVAEGAPDTAAARSISWLLMHEVDTWVVGGQKLDGSEPTRFVVRVAVPSGSLDDAKRADMVQRITRVLADADDNPERFSLEPVAWVHINEIPEGNWGALGRVVGFADIAGFVVTGSTEPSHASVPA
jgi:phenylpyruvate tautomerase PptA (4-oxalocrotonate tautomerase family)